MTTFPIAERERHYLPIARAMLPTQTAIALGLVTFMIGIAATAVTVRFPPITTSIHKRGAQDTRRDRAKVIAASAATQVTIVRLTASGMITSAIALTITHSLAEAAFRLTPLALTPLSVVPAPPAIPRRSDVCRRQLRHRHQNRLNVSPWTCRVIPGAALHVVTRALIGVVALRVSVPTVRDSSMKMVCAPRHQL